MALRGKGTFVISTDMNTLWVAPVLISIASTCAFAGLARYAPAVPGPRIWMLAPLCQALVMGSMLLPVEIVDIRSRLLLLSIHALAAPFIWAAGTQRFYGRRPLNTLCIGLFSIGLAVSTTLIYVWPQPVGRVVVGCAFNVIGWLLAGITVWRTPEGSGRTPARTLALVFMALAASIFVRGILFYSGHTVPSAAVSGKLEGIDAVVWAFALMANVLTAPVLVLLVAVRLNERINVEKRRAESSEAMFRGLAVSASVGILVTDAHGERTYANPRTSEILGRESNEVLGAGWRAAFDQQALSGAFTYLTKHDARVNGESVFLVVKPDGTKRWVHWKRAPLDAEHVGRFVSTIDDITELRDAHERVRDLVQRLEHIREGERGFVAQALHEEIAQDLAAIAFLVGAMPRCSEDAIALTSMRESISSELSRCMQRLRELTNTLRPPMLAHLPLPDAIEHYARSSTRERNISVEVFSSGSFGDLEEDAQLVFFRAAEEAISNVLRHAQASRITLAFDQKDGMSTMKVVDNGIGLTDDDLQKVGAIGILRLRERFAALGGGVRVSRGELCGTILAAYL